MRKFEFKPWGWYLTIDEGSDYKVKKIYVKPKSRFSLQYHHKRDEYWTIIQGSGIITYEKDGDEINLESEDGSLLSEDVAKFTLKDPISLTDYGELEFGTDDVDTTGLSVSTLGKAW